VAACKPVAKAKHSARVIAMNRPVLIGVRMVVFMDSLWVFEIGGPT
jgi:hypothetical protein